MWVVAIRWSDYEGIVVECPSSLWCSCTTPADVCQCGSTIVLVLLVSIVSYLMSSTHQTSITPTSSLILLCGINLIIIDYGSHRGVPSVIGIWVVMVMAIPLLVANINTRLAQG